MTGIGALWTTLVNLLKNVPFLDEALWDWGRDFFKGGAKGAAAVTASAAAATAAATPNDAVPSARRAVGFLYTDHVTPTALMNWQKVVWLDPEFKPYQEQVEVAIEDFLERLEEREGVFPVKNGGKTVTETGTGDKKKIVTVTPLPQTPRETFNGHELFVQAINKAGETDQGVKLFVEGITHQKIFERVGDQLGGVLKQVKFKPALTTVLVAIAIYSILLLGSGGIAFVSFWYLVTHPTSLVAAVVGFLALAVFGLLANPLAKRILPGG